MKTIEVNQIKLEKTYHIAGDMENGYWNGKPYIVKEEITRPITRVSETKVYCKCGRVFLINENLTIQEVAYENY